MGPANDKLNTFTSAQQYNSFKPQNFFDITWYPPSRPGTGEYFPPQYLLPDIKTPMPKYPADGNYPAPGLTNIPAPPCQEIEDPQIKNKEEIPEVCGAFIFKIGKDSVKTGVNMPINQMSPLYTFAVGIKFPEEYINPYTPDKYPDKEKHPFKCFF